MSTVKKIGIIGFGTVGSGVYETLVTKREKITHLIGSDLEIPVILVKDAARKRHVANDTKVTDRFEEVIALADLDVVIEVSPDAETGYPYVHALLSKGITVITANKELVAKHGETLLPLADANNCRLYYEAAVAGGIPVLSSIRHTLKTNDILQLEGIVNGTSNFILTKMREEGAAFDVALAEAQEKGYAEAVPDKDVDGWDAYFKTTILSQWLFGRAPVWQSAIPIGIRGIRLEDLTLAEKIGGRIKHVAALENISGQPVASVRPHLILTEHPLYAVEGVNNAIHLEGSIVGSIAFQGPGAGKFPTASAIVEDLVNHLSHTSEKQPDVLNISMTRNEEKSFTPKQTKVWFVTGKQLTLQLEGSRSIDTLSNILYSEGKEAVLLTGNEREVISTMTKLNDSITIYPVTGAQLEKLENMNKKAVFSR
ncbi:homoserine dehydrogenase [Salipaludibacillus agaradhaerens]|uniref:Homoserine dehydrogenase n=1 Tax=Salipaludibacillus agaradhaerens TaxID=76935 RepID=A0A9Q4AYW4_SALAG|nr:homoserine dehydrogenase [Salipaludibacillus agaradhaerens]MCR6095199.1 homoserine dehydrogenase [Salipaludibacillus agaradhaerens]MCR6115243.1 homoserine dehydrogenase [Salipaludibacillus agaradhaerens]